MLWSKLFIPTLREAPAGVEDPGVSLLIRAGYQRAGGVHLPLGHRSLTKLAAMVRQELNALGGQEMLSPHSLSAVGGPQSQKQLPQLWYQVQFPTRIEVVSFDVDQERMDATRRAIEEAFARVLTRCGVSFTKADGQSGSRDGRASAFVALSGHGSTKIAICEEAGYAATLAVAHAMPKPPLAADPDGIFKPERFHTPNRKTIADLVEFTGLPASSQMKTLIQICDGKPYLVLVRGDHQLSRPKLAAIVGSKEAVPASPQDVAKWFGANPGSLGPVGVTNMPVLADNALQGRRNMTCGANEDDYHLRHVTPGVDFQAQFEDLRKVEEGDMCPSFPAAVSIKTSHELANVSATASEFKLDAILTTVAELNQDPDGLVLAPPLAPFEIVITPTNFNDEAQRKAALALYGTSKDSKILLDDRDERPGVKFKDADLIGIPLRITVGKKLAEGLVEVVMRKGRHKADVPLADVRL